MPQSQNKHVWVVFVAIATVLSTAVNGVTRDFSSYRSTNELVWDKNFRKEIKKIFGRQRGSYYWPNGKLAEQALDGLGGPPQPLQSLESQWIWVAACRTHSCPEKAAAILEKSGTVRAVAFIHFPCAQTDPNRPCDSKPRLTIFLGKTSRESVSRYFERWAEHDGPLAGIEYR